MSCIEDEPNNPLLYAEFMRTFSVGENVQRAFHQFGGVTLEYEVGDRGFAIWGTEASRDIQAYGVPLPSGMAVYFTKEMVRRCSDADSLNEADVVLVLQRAFTQDMRVKLFMETDQSDTEYRELFVPQDFHPVLADSFESKVRGIGVGRGYELYRTQHGRERNVAFLDIAKHPIRMYPSSEIMEVFSEYTLAEVGERVRGWVNTLLSITQLLDSEAGVPLCVELIYPPSGKLDSQRHAGVRVSVDMVYGPTENSKEQV